MSTYVLIHGSWHGGWCWEKVVPLLEREGHEVEAPDLPGHGEDKTPNSQISLQTYSDCVCQILDAQSEPVVLVGHSRGGIIISQAAESRPDKIKTLVYLTAFLLRNGESMRQVARGDKESFLQPNLIIDESQGYTVVKDEVIKEALYADCSDEDVARAKSLLVPEPNAPTETPLRLSEENFGRVRRIYIECLRDRAVSPSLQRQMYTALPCRRVISMDASHSPFFSAPEELVTHLTSL
ncbi:MAG: alpha/beta fold hydrolase [Nitrospinota bacterium]